MLCVVDHVMHGPCRCRGRSSSIYEMEAFTAVEHVYVPSMLQRKPGSLHVLQPKNWGVQCFLAEHEDSGSTTVKPRSRVDRDEDRASASPSR